MSVKTFRVTSPIRGWFTIDSGEIVQTTQTFSWSLHLIPDKLLTWLRNKGELKMERLWPTI